MRPSSDLLSEIEEGIEEYIEELTEHEMEDARKWAIVYEGRKIRKAAEYIRRKRERTPQVKHISILRSLPMLMHLSGDAVVCGRYRDSKPFGLIIRAKLNEQNVRPEELIGKRVLWIFKLSHDSNGLLRPYLRIYTRSDGPQDADNDLHVIQFFEKCVASGATAKGSLSSAATVIHDSGPLYSGGASTHWERHVISIVPFGTDINAWVDRKGAKGRTWAVRA